MGSAVARELVQRALSAELGCSTNEVLTSNTTKVFPVVFSDVYPVVAITEMAFVCTSGAIFRLKAFLKRTTRD